MQEVQYPVISQGRPALNLSKEVLIKEKHQVMALAGTYPILPHREVKGHIMCCVVRHAIYDRLLHTQLCTNHI